MDSVIESQLYGSIRSWAGFRGQLPGGGDVFGASCTWAGDPQAAKLWRDVRGVRVDGMDFPWLVIHRRGSVRGMRPLLHGFSESTRVLDVEHVGFPRRWKVVCPSGRFAHDLLLASLVPHYMAGEFNTEPSGALYEVRRSRSFQEAEPW